MISYLHLFSIFCCLLAVFYHILKCFNNRVIQLFRWIWQCFNEQHSILKKGKKDISYLSTWRLDTVRGQSKLIQNILKFINMHITQLALHNLLEAVRISLCQNAFSKLIMIQALKFLFSCTISADSWEQKWKESSTNLTMKTEFHILIYFYFLLFFIASSNALRISPYKSSGFFLVSVSSPPSFLYRNNILYSDSYKDLTWLNTDENFFRTLSNPLSLAFIISASLSCVMSSKVSVYHHKSLLTLNQLFESLQKSHPHQAQNQINT